MKYRMIACAAALAASLPLAAAAQAGSMTILARAGGWEAFGGLSEDGRPLCGMSTSGGGRWLGVKYFMGDPSVTIQLSEDAWSVSNNAAVEVMMQFDDETPWAVNATAFHMSDGDAALEFRIGRQQITQWTREFAKSYTLYVRFPRERNIADWQADLTSTQEMVGAWTLCLEAMQAAR